MRIVIALIISIPYIGAELRRGKTCRIERQPGITRLLKATGSIGFRADSQRESAKLVAPSAPKDAFAVPKELIKNNIANDAGFILGFFLM